MKRTYRESLEYFRNHPEVRPSGVALAMEEPHSIDEVVLAGTLRYRIVGELSHEQFLEWLRINRQYLSQVAAVASMVGSRIDMETAEDKAEPGPEFKYFYTAECV